MQIFSKNSNSQGDQGSLTTKLSIFFSLMILELISSTICGFLLHTHIGRMKLKEDKLAFDIKLDQERFLFIFAGVAAFLQLSILFWIFTLTWQTFLFKSGLVAILRREFPLLFLLLPLNFLLFAGEKAFRIVSFDGVRVEILRGWFWRY